MTMYSPDLETFSTMMGRAGLVPLHRTIVADLDTPLTIFAKVAGEDEHAFLFESMEGGEKWGRYSFIGLDPLLTFESIRDRITISGTDIDTGKVVEGVNPLAELRKLLASFNASTAPGLPRFYGGAVGFLGYDMIRFIEEIPDSHEPLDIPDSSFIVPRLVLIHDSVNQTLTVVCNVVAGNGDDESKLYRDGCLRIDALIRKLRQPLPDSLAKHSAAVSPHDFTSNMDEQGFSAMVERAKEYILSGDIIQVVLSQRFHSKTEIDPSCSIVACAISIPAPTFFTSVWAMSC
jgi:anthranilate synthase component 1